MLPQRTVNSYMGSAVLESSNAIKNIQKLCFDVPALTRGLVKTRGMVPFVQMGNVNFVLVVCIIPCMRYLRGCEFVG